MWGLMVTLRVEGLGVLPLCEVTDTCVKKNQAFVVFGGGILSYNVVCVF